MRIVKDFIGPFPNGEHLQLSKAERDTLAKAAAIAEKAANFFEPDSFPWMEWKKTEMNCAESAGLR